MKKWVQRLLGAKSKPLLSSSASPPPPPSWAAVRGVAALVSGDDSRVADWLVRAEDDWQAFEDAANAESRDFGEWFVDAEVGDPVVALRAVLVEEGYLGYLDWKSPAKQVLWSFSKVLERVGLESLSDAQVAVFEALEPVDRRQVDLFFPDLALPLRTYLEGTDHRLIGCDEGGDSYPFAVVGAEAYSALVGVKIGWLSFYDVGDSFPRS